METYDNEIYILRKERMKSESSRIYGVKLSVIYMHSFQTSNLVLKEILTKRQPESSYFVNFYVT